MGQAMTADICYLASWRSATNEIVWRKVGLFACCVLWKVLDTSSLSGIPTGQNDDTVINQAGKNVVTGDLDWRSTIIKSLAGFMR